MPEMAVRSLAKPTVIKWTIYCFKISCWGQHCCDKYTVKPILHSLQSFAHLIYPKSTYHHTQPKPLTFVTLCTSQHLQHARFPCAVTNTFCLASRKFSHDFISLFPSPGPTDHTRTHQKFANDYLKLSIPLWYWRILRSSVAGQLREAQIDSVPSYALNGSHGFLNSDPWFFVTTDNFLTQYDTQLSWTMLRLNATNTSLVSSVVANYIT